MINQFTIGNYSDINNTNETVKLYLSLPSEEVDVYWSRCGLISNFSSSYIALACSTAKNITNSLSFIINELLENAVKYSFDKNKKIEVCLLQNRDTITVEVSNYISSSQTEKMTKKAKELIDVDYVNSRYLDIMTSNAKGESRSGIGMLTIINYYNVAMSFNFSSTDETNSVYKLSIQVRINIKEL